jgi:hypothetical protein
MGNTGADVIRADGMNDDIQVNLENYRLCYRLGSQAKR